MKYFVKQLTVFLENKPGELASFTHILSGKNVNIKSLILVESTEYGLVRAIVDNPQKAKAVLESAGLSVRFSDVLAVKIKDEVGSFDRIVTILSKNDINILYTYSFYSANSGIFIFSIDNLQKGINTLLEANENVLEAAYFYE
ncbi:MAG: amino acid-binding protein [Campylobacteraceae bacterium]|jgi:hypothetical protein|nr:amino acid-binding protein [Campylobacteraceae bacterium]